MSQKDNQLPPTLVGNIPEQAVSDEPAMHPFVYLVIRSFDSEYVRLGIREKLQPQGATPEHLQGIVSEFISLSLRTDFYTFFVLRNLEQLVEQVFQDINVRTYVLNMTEAVSAASSWTEGADADMFVENLVVAIGRTRPEPTETCKSLILKEILQTTYIDPEALAGLLKDNFWIVVLYVLLLNMQHSYVFSTVTGNLNKSQPAPAKN